jgi:hypothetical protein
MIMDSLQGLWINICLRVSSTFWGGHVSGSVNLARCVSCWPYADSLRASRCSCAYACYAGAGLPGPGVCWILIQYIYGALIL